MTRSYDLSLRLPGFFPYFFIPSRRLFGIRKLYDAEHCLKKIHRTAISRLQAGIHSVRYSHHPGELFFRTTYLF